MCNVEIHSGESRSVIVCFGWRFTVSIACITYNTPTTITSSMSLTVCIPVNNISLLFLRNMQSIHQHFHLLGIPVEGYIWACLNILELLCYYTYINYIQWNLKGHCRLKIQYKNLSIKNKLPSIRHSTILPLKEYDKKCIQAPWPVCPL